MAFLQIISDNILPLLVFVAIGYFLDRRFTLNVTSLTKLTFYIVLPSFIFYSIYVAKIDLTMLNVFLMSFVQMFLIGFIAWLAGKMRGMSASKTEALKNGTMFSNNGNIGIALIALVFGNAPYLIDGEAPYLAEASACATIMLVQMNMSLNTLGLYQAGKGKLTPRDALSVVFHMPVIYTLVTVFAIKFSGFDMTQLFLWPVFENCANALVAIVMIALGMQIHRSTLSFGDLDAWIGCFIRLVIGHDPGLRPHRHPFLSGHQSDHPHHVFCPRPRELRPLCRRISQLRRLRDRAGHDEYLPLLHHHDQRHIPRPHPLPDRMMSDKTSKKGYDHQASMVIAFFDVPAPRAAKGRGGFPHGTNLYPTPQMVRMCFGCAGSSSTASRMRLIWTGTVAVLPSESIPQMRV